MYPSHLQSLYEKFDRLTDPLTCSHSNYIWSDPQQLHTLYALLSQFLDHYSDIWMHKPFKKSKLAWWKTYPELMYFLQQKGKEIGATITYDESTQQWHNPKQIHAQLHWQEIVEYLPGIELLAHIPDLKVDSCLHLDDEPNTVDHLHLVQHGVKVHKKRQIEALLKHVASQKHIQSSVLDWCGGKGHLARHIAHTHHVETSCLEWDQQLIQSAQKSKANQNVPVHFHALDALSKEAWNLATGYQHIVALHACGPLHRRLLTIAQQHTFKSLNLVPCCYSLDHTAHSYCTNPYAFSQVLTPELTTLATQQRNRVSTRRDQGRTRGLAMRLGFSVLIAEHIHNTWPRYQSVLHESSLHASPLHPRLYPLLPIRSTSRASNHLPFQKACFLYWQASDLDEINFPSLSSHYTTQQWQDYEYQGWYNLALQTPFEQLRQLFQSTLERFLILDRACSLLQHNASYEINIKKFCTSDITPRNYLIQAMS